MMSKSGKYFPWLIIGLAVIAIYWQSLANGFIWDDDYYVYNNQLLFGLFGLKSIWFSTQTPQYYPLVFSSFWLEHLFWGNNPFGYHLTNLFLHITNSGLVFVLARRLGIKLAVVAGIIFAIHPIQVETVAWITERKNLLSLFFVLLFSLRYLQFEQTQNKKIYYQAVILFICALLSKSVAACFCLIPILWQWAKHGQVNIRSIKLALPLILFGAIAGFNTAYLEVNKVGALGEHWSLSLGQKIILAGKVFWFYLYKIFVPVDFIFFYPQWRIDPGNWQQWLFPVSVIALILWLYLKRDRFGRASVVWAKLYVLGLFPVMGFLNVYPMRYSFVADHFSYFATAVVFIVLAAIGQWVWDRSYNKWRILSVIVFAGICVFLAKQTMTLTRDYKDQIVLWNSVILRNPGSYAAYNNLALEYQNQGKIDEAIAGFKKAIEFNPEFARGYNNLANIYKDQGKLNDAKTLYELAIKKEPGCVQAYTNLGTVYFMQGNLDQAKIFYNRSIEMSRDYPDPYNNLGVIYQNQGHYQQAIALYKKALSFDPYFIEGLYNLGNAYYGLSQYKQAQAMYEQAVRLSPSYRNAWHNLALTYQRLGKNDLARSAFDKAKTNENPFN